METYPRQAASTGQFRHGAPRSARITEQAVYFLRSADGRSPALDLHRWDRETGTTDVILSGSGDSMTAAERALRERLRESASGITAFDVRDGRVVATAAGSVLLWDAEAGARSLDAAGAFDARLSPDGAWVSWISGGALQVCPWDGGQARTIVEPDGDEIWAVVDFIAAEELGRSRGYWWLPDSDGLLVQRTDESGVLIWHRSDPTHPEMPPAAQRYPAAGTPNAQVELWRFDLDGEGVRVELPENEYLVDAGELISTFDRAQTALTLMDSEGVLTTLRGEPWLDLVPGLPRRDKAGRLLAWLDGPRRQLTIDGEPATPPDVHLRSLVGVMNGAVYVLAADDPAESRVARVAEGFEWLTPAGSYATATCGDGLLVTSEVDWETYRATVTVRDASNAVLATLENFAEEPSVAANPQRVPAGLNEVQTVVLWPAAAADGPLPVLMAPYGGPHGQRVLASRSAYATAQWLADQGFCVVIADGRGTPGQSPAFEHAVAGNLRDLALEDQVLALHTVAEQFPGRLDLDRVGILGWSYGGYLAALAVLQRPDVFHAAVAGAPVTEWRLYDTAYTERYLGNPADDPAPYDHSSLLPLAGELQRALLLIHGLADDNVFAANTLQLSQALLAAGRPHEVLPLSGVSHMTPQPEVAENLLLLQVDFFRRNLCRP